MERAGELVVGIEGDGIYRLVEQCWRGAKVWHKREEKRLDGDEDVTEGSLSLDLLSTQTTSEYQYVEKFCTSTPILLSLETPPKFHLPVTKIYNVGEVVKSV